MKPMKRNAVLIYSAAVIAAALLPCQAVAAEKPRTISLIEDRGQHYMTTKVYELKHAKAHDVLPFVKGAIKRFDAQSTIQSLDYAEGKKQYLVVSTGSSLLPMIDAMIAKLDYPSKKLGVDGSVIDGDGIFRYAYCAKYRSSENMRDVVSQTFAAGVDSGASYFDVPTNMFYWKSSKSQGDEYMKLLSMLDRPVPQVELTLNVYLITDNYFRELGIDYLAWKNGPGMELFSTGFNFTNFFSDMTFEKVAEIFTDGPASSAMGLGGLVIAPQFDATFLRMLAQKGKARMATSASLTLGNDFTTAAPQDYDSAAYRFKFTPQYQNIMKDENMVTSVTAGDNSEFSFFVGTPVICFGDNPAEGAKTLMCSYDLSVSTLVEATNLGIETVDTNHFVSSLTLEVGKEKLLASFDKEIENMQYNGMPFFSEIPVLKYIFGAESKVKSKARVFVTVSAKPVVSANSVPTRAGIVTAAAAGSAKTPGTDVAK